MSPELLELMRIIARAAMRPKPLPESLKCPS
jgi:hypothetical protein